MSNIKIFNILSGPPCDFELHASCPQKGQPNINFLSNQYHRNIKMFLYLIKLQRRWPIFPKALQWHHQLLIIPFLFYLHETHQTHVTTTNKLKLNSICGFNFLWFWREFSEGLNLYLSWHIFENLKNWSNAIKLFEGKAMKPRYLIRYKPHHKYLQGVSPLI